MWSLWWGFRPDPRELGKEIAVRYPESVPHGGTRLIREIMLQPAALTAVLAMVLGQVVMVALMVVTSQHMNQHQHDLADRYTEHGHFLRFFLTAKSAKKCFSLCVLGVLRGSIF